VRTCSLHRSSGLGSRYVWRRYRQSSSCACTHGWAGRRKTMSVTKWPCLHLRYFPSLCSEGKVGWLQCLCSRADSGMQQIEYLCEVLFCCMSWCDSSSARWVYMYILLQPRHEGPEPELLAVTLFGVCFAKLHALRHSPSGGKSQSPLICSLGQIVEPNSPKPRPNPSQPWL